jgi:hypothetical protein
MSNIKVKKVKASNGPKTKIIKKTYIKRPWTAQHEKKLNWLFNYMLKNNNDLKKDDFIIKKKRDLISIINNNNEWSIGSKEGLLFMVARFLYNNGYIKDAARYSSWGKELTNKINDETELNELDEKEKENYKEHSYFTNILNKINVNDINNQTDNQHYLLLSLLVLQPPVRTSFYSSCKFINNISENNKKDNYIYFNRRGKTKAYYIINKDKATNYKLYALDPALSKIEIENDDLANLLYDSYVKYPRTYLFEYRNKKITDNTILSWLRKITKVDKINVDMMRSSYITHFYENNKTFYKRNILSKKMRHSVNVAQKNYNKVLNTEGKDENELLIEAKNELYDLQQKLHDCNKNEGLHQIKENKVLTKKNRTDALYNINVRNKQPKESTLKKYNIIYNEELKKYI